MHMLGGMEWKHAKGDPQLIRSLNRRLVIDVLRRTGRVSRTDLVRAVGVKPSTITSIVQELIGEGLVREVGPAASARVGRRPILLALDPRYGQTWGCYIQSRNVSVGCVTLDGRLAASAEVHYEAGSSIEVVLAALERAVNRLPRPERLLGTGVCVAGVVRSHERTLVHSPSMGWSDVRLGERLDALFGGPVVLANDVNAWTVGERWHGAGRAFQNFLCISVGEGVGGGIYLEDRLYEGIHGGAGEIGHTCIQLDGPPCRCGEAGCLEALTSDAFLAREAEALGLPTDPDALVAAAAAGDARALDLFRRMGTHLGVGLKNLVNLFNPQAIVIAGDRLNAFTYFQPAMEAVLRERCFARLGRGLSVLPSRMGEAGWMIGAGTLPLRERFSPSILARPSLRVAA